MIEVELKFRLREPEDLLARLIARGAVARDAELEQDVYFAHPGRDFSQSGEALRLRQSGGEAILTYKGPYLDRVSKSREEREVRLAGVGEVDGARTVLERLGFQPVRGVSKRRTTFQIPSEDLEILLVLDDVEGLGLFVELETLAEDAVWEAARERLNGLACELGLSDPERRSYLELLLLADSEGRT
ncbi:MAG: class IV adenylate cyclase [Planctomyces sp.]|nr:class IV adenylate cyclase [Planctomyces sp.]